MFKLPVFDSRFRHMANNEIGPVTCPEVWLISRWRSHLALMTSTGNAAAHATSSMMERPPYWRKEEKKKKTVWETHEKNINKHSQHFERCSADTIDNNIYNGTFLSSDKCILSLHFLVESSRYLWILNWIFHYIGFEPSGKLVVNTQSANSHYDEVPIEQQPVPKIFKKVPKVVISQGG